jgi:hypothetical protein
VVVAVVAEVMVVEAKMAGMNVGDTSHTLVITQRKNGRALALLNVLV